MYDSRTDKWHSQNGSRRQNADDYDFPERLRVRSSEKRAALAYEARLAADVLAEPVRRTGKTERKRAARRDLAESAATDEALAFWDELMRAFRFRVQLPVAVVVLK